MGRRNWSAIVEEARRFAAEHKEKYGVAPTLRAIFYVLVSKGFISNTRSSYNYLSKVLSEKRIAGEFEWGLIEDRTRTKIRRRRSDLLERDFREAEMRLLLYIDAGINIITRFYVNPWDDQPRRVIVAIEKDALLPLIDAMINKATGELVDGEVWAEPAYVEELIVMRGYNSTTEMKKLADEINSLPEDVKPVVLLLGDFDPSGEDIARDFRERLIEISGRSDIEFEKVAVTLDQIIELDLPASPESIENVEKLMRDTRYRGFVEKLEKMASQDQRYRELVERYRTPDGEIAMMVELDALAAIYPDYLERVLKEAIKRHFDVKTYLEKTKPKMEEQKRIAEELREHLERKKKKWMGAG
ncbi:MAG: hypothetical protein RQ885_06500 [Desulfurococcales archaeon]|jgi:5S rRNA maturation endonuclease (ribonuclease M5)|nr:hypothetical protein [Desulfurococcales archaeon]